MRVFLAGASGALGKQLVPRLVAAGHEVFGTTRSAVNADALSGSAPARSSSTPSTPTRWRGRWRRPSRKRSSTS